MVGIQSTGIGSNLDVNSLISKLMQVESQPLTNLAKKEASYQSKLTAYGTLSGALNSFQSNFVALNSSATFQNLSATSSDTSVAGVTTSSVATAGTYNLNVTKLAQAQIVQSAGQTSTTSAIGGGSSTTIAFQFGTISGGSLSAGVYTGATYTQDGNQGTGSVTIDSTNNSLQGIRDAINTANLGVAASIVGDGSATPYHLVLNSSKTGATSSLKVTVTGDATLQTLLNYNPAGTQNLTEATGAQNAAFTVNGISISSASNTVTEAIQGSTVTLSKIGTASLTLATNTSAVQNFINSFVKGYNDLQATLKTLTGYDAASKKGGVLLGDATARSVQDQLRTTLATAVNGLGGTYTTLTSIGITFQKDGTLSSDATKLQAALTNAFSDVSGIFAAIGKASDGLVKYSSATAATKQGAYTVNVSTLATQGALVGNTDLTAGNTTIAASTKINVTLDGVVGSVSLAAGTYTSSQLATLVQTSINGTSTFSSIGAKVAATITGGGFLQLQSASYGSASNVTIASDTGTSAAALTGSNLAGTVGVNVAGSFNGVGGTGVGQFLTGSSGTNSEGLQVSVTGGVTGARGTVNFSRGYANQLVTLIASTVGTSGTIANSTEGVNKTIKDIGNQRALLNSRLIDTEARYRAQFTALDRTISSLNNTSTFLTQQLAALTGTNKL